MTGSTPGSGAPGPRLLVLAGAWPPLESPRATNNHRLLSRLSFQIEAVVPAAPGAERQAEPAGQGLEVRRLWDPTFDRFHSIMRRLGVPTEHMPDRHLLWAFQAALSGLRRLPRADVLVTVSSPLSTHLAGLLARRMHGRRIPWLAYFSDPWSDWEGTGYELKLPFAVRWNRWLEDRVLEEIDAFAFPSSELAEHFREGRPVIRGRPFAVIPQSFDADEYPAEVHRPPRQATPLLRFIGSFYGPRSPAPLIAALSELARRRPRAIEELRLEMFGSWPDKEEKARCMAELERYGGVVHRGSVSFQESLRLMVECDALLHVGVPTDKRYFQPSKLVDYLGANRPIIAACSGGAEEVFVRRAGGLSADVRNPEEVAMALEKVLDLHERNALETLVPPPEFRDQYRATAVAAAFEGFIARLGVVESSRARRLSEA